MQAIEAVVVLGAHQHEVVELAGNDVALKAARHLLHGLLERRKRFRRGAIKHHAYHHQRAGIQRARRLTLAASATLEIEASRCSSLRMARSVRSRLALKDSVAALLLRNFVAFIIRFSK